jgi:hypothetical protein
LKSDRFNTYTQTEDNDRFGELIKAAPETLDTLFELAKSLWSDENYDTHVQTQMNGKANGGVSYSITQLDQLLTGMPSGLNNRVLISAVNI